jgi:peptidyl-prolyl cis-trans isomerase SurA
MVALPQFAAAQGVQRIAAVVNEDVISAYELNQRVLMVMVTGRIPDTEENRRRLSTQILRNMIDEQLQLQEAKRLNIRISDEEIDKVLVQLNKQNDLPAGSLEKILARANVDINVLRAKLRADESWGKVIRNQLRQQVFISDEEVEEELNRIKAVKDLPRHRVAEIFLPVDNPDNQRQVLELANRLIQQTRNGANFSALAREFSQSASAAVGGDLGWVTKGQLDPIIDQTIARMNKGEVAGPIQTLAGYYVLYVIEKVDPAAGGAASRMPTAAEIRQRLGNNRFNLLVQRYMRDLRQTAFVDIRG